MSAATHQIDRASHSSGVGRYAVYLGDGIYLRSRAREGEKLICGAQGRGWPRQTAIEALHAARRDGLGGWLVPFTPAVQGAAS